MDLFEYFRCNSLFIKLSQKLHLISSLGGFPNGAVVKNPPANAGDVGLIPRLGRFPWRGKWQPTPMLLPGKLHGQRSLVGCSPWGRKSQSWLSMHRCTHTPKLTSFRAIGNSHYQDQHLFPNMLLPKSREADIDKDIKLYKISQFWRHRTWVILHCWLNQFLTVLDLHTIHFTFHY